VALVAVVAVGGVLGRRRAAREPDPAPSPPAAADEVRSVRRLLAENIALRREAAELGRALAAAPRIPGLPPLEAASADEKRMMGEIGKRIFDDLRPRAEQLYRQLAGRPPPPDMPMERLLAALLDAAPVQDPQALLDEMNAHKRIYRPGSLPPPEASRAQQVLWLLDDADDALVRELADALPPERFRELQSSPLSEVGFTIQQRNGHWVVKQSPAL
jgi:hypothetical protein